VETRAGGTKHETRIGLFVQLEACQWKDDGTQITLAVIGGQIFTYDASGDSWTTAVSTANFSSAGITRTTTGRWFACTFNNAVVFSDGTNKPFTWDGTTGAGGLTLLSNASGAWYGGPTVYYGKLFGILASDRGTIEWSEENAANTGYQAGGYNNSWTLGQTGSAPLSIIIGTNAFLYYFRDGSIGAISGAVTPDFATTGTHDAVSDAYGCRGASAATFYDAGTAQTRDPAIWFVNQLGRPMVLPIGARPIDLGEDMERRVYPNVQATNDPYGHWEIDVAAVTYNLSNANVAYLAVVYCAAWDAVCFFYPPNIGPGIFAAVYSVRTRRLMGYFTVVTDTMTAVGRVQVQAGTSSVSDTIMVLDGSGNAAVVRAGAFFSTGNVYRDELTASTRTPNYRMIGRRMVHDTQAGMHFDRFTLESRFSGLGLSWSAQFFTSERWNSSEAASAQSVTQDAGGADVQQPRRYSLGLAQYGRWIAPAIALSTSAVSKEGRIYRYAVDAFVDAAEAEMV